MEEGKVIISVEEYKKLIKTQERCEIFADFLNTKCFVDREECAMLLGFELKEQKND